MPSIGSVVLPVPMSRRKVAGCKAPVSPDSSLVGKSDRCIPITLAQQMPPSFDALTLLHDGAETWHRGSLC